MNEWGIPISKDKIIARRNRLIEYQKLGELRFTPLYEAIDENILDINYMLHEIDNLQSKIDKANEILEEILVVRDWEHEGRFRPVKGTTAQDVYKTIIKLNELLETPRKINYELLKEDK